MKRVEYDHQASLNEVLNYIQSNLHDSLNLTEVAAKGGYSPFYFHRLFKLHLGETVQDYIARERIERAARLLRSNPHESITEIAMACGFGSPSVFARAFRKRFGVSASEYREQYSKNSQVHRNDGQSMRNDEQATGNAFLYDKHIAADATMLNIGRVQKMTVEVRNLEQMKVAYARIQGYEPSVVSEKIGGAFDQVQQWLAARDFDFSTAMKLGIFYDHTTTPDELRRYDAAFTLPSDTTITEGSNGVHLQQIDGKYAVVRVEVAGTDNQAFLSALKQLDQAFTKVLNEWLPASPYALEDKPCIEHYVSCEPNMVLEGFIPLKLK
ncbi:AraC family transcriptional regulator [Paenibacillus sp. 481]|uniref:AraC family transcriptional regulator n=1 Tax=Paenibacillus sp. 481 TaxID=2835869 RepID=UPI001E5A9F89|nr:helix-turn-helix domain-containing protein [Paenibacillus sp. 481]UHA72782.1 helix-turn-helix domain-containing protein [Paenibacillus sp. 481]